VAVVRSSVGDLGGLTKSILITLRIARTLCCLLWDGH